MQADLDPSLAPGKTWRFNMRANNALSLKQGADDEQQRILDSEKLMDPGQTPDGATFTHPWTGQQMEMSPGVRYTLGLRSRQAQKNADVLSTRAQQRFKDLGVRIPAAAQSSASRFHGEHDGCGRRSRERRRARANIRFVDRGG